MATLTDNSIATSIFTESRARREAFAKRLNTCPHGENVVLRRCAAAPGATRKASARGRRCGRRPMPVDAWTDLAIMALGMVGIVYVTIRGV